MRLSPWLAPLTVPRSRLADKVVRRKVPRRRTLNRLSQMTERLEARTLLTSFTVDSFFDTPDANPGDGSALDSAGQTSLRAAIMEANANADTDVINLGAGIYSLSIEGTDEDGATTGDLDVLNNLQIFGQSPQTTFIDARSIDRVFDVFPGVQLVLFNLTITGGDLAGRGDGGGVRVNQGTLFLDDSVITNSRASNGGAISNIGGNVTTARSTLSDNRAEGNAGFTEGGAISSFGGNVTIRQSTINGNFAQTVGGGVSTGADTLGGTLSIESSTIAQNHAGDMQGGSGAGGGIYIQANVTATLLASTVALNSAGSQGAGLWTNGSLTMERTIVSNNSGTPDDGPEGFISGGTVTSNGFNLVREDTDFNFTPATGDLIGNFASPIDPNLQGLTDNGGPTQTIALGGISPAIDAGPSFASPLFVDQRGFARERDGDRNGSVITDIGAFEVQAPSDFFVDDIGSGVISGGRAGDFVVTTDNGTIGVLDAGDFVTFDPDGQPVFNLEFGVRAFGTINEALTAIRFDSDFLTEVVLGPGTYTENLALDFSGLTLRGHTGIATDVVIDGGGSATAISVVEDSVSLASLRVTNATTGVDVAPLSSAQFFNANNIQVDGTTNGLLVFDSIGLMDVSIENSVFTGNTGDGINITNVGTAMLKNVSSTLNGQDGVEIVSTPIVAFDTVTVDQNSGRGMVVDGADTIAVMDPRTSASTSGNVFSNSSVLFFNGVAGDVTNATTITATEIQFDAGAVQEDITLTNITSLFVTGDEGNDTLTVDYSTGSPSPSRQLFLDGGPGNDTIISIANANHRVTEARLTIGGIDEVAITSFEQASLTGGVGNNNLDASGFHGQTTLFGLAGNDTLRGSSGDDVLDGGADDDILRSGPTHEHYILGATTFESLNLTDSDIDVTTILDETDTETATILLDSDIFRFNDITFSGNSLFVAPSGVVSFGGPIFPQNNFDLTDAPNNVGGIPILAPLFDDWVTGITSPPGLTLPGAKVLYKFEDTNADFINDRLIIEWNEVYHRDQIDTLSTPFIKAGASPVTFQVILELNTFDRDGDITFNYVDLDTGAPFSAIADGTSATVGGKDSSENPSGIEQISFNSPNSLIGSGKAIVARSGTSDGDDILIGGVGEDTLFSSSGRDSVDGGVGANDQLVFAGLRNELASDHTISGSAIESTIFPGQGRTYDFKTTYSNVESLDIGFGPADQNVLVELSGLPADVSLDTRGPSASDKVTINGTAGNDALTLSGETLTNGTTTLNIAGVEELTLEISSGGADTISVEQDFTGSARTIIVSGDSADDSVSLQSTNKPQQVNIFNNDAYIVQIQEDLGGDLILEEILANNEDDGSENNIENQQAPDQVIVSPDGTRVYVAASDSDALVVYGRNRVTGDLTFIESLVNLSTDFLGNPISGLDGTSNVIVSADGRFVYVASEVDQTIAFFVQHEGDNQLTFITSTILDTAGNPFNIPLPSDMAFIPDGSVLMATSEGGNRVDFFEVSDSGDLTFQASLVDGGRDSGMTTIDGLGGASSIAISPDGRFLYVTGATDNAIAVFSSPDQGSQMTGLELPSFVEKLANLDMDGALNIVTGLGGASSVEVSPDGQHVYVTGETDNSIVVFSRDSSTGQLTFVEKLVDGGIDSMSNTVENLSAPVSVSISPEGTKVYVAASGSNAVTVFARDFSTGALTFLESLADGDTDGAGNTVAGVNNVSSVFASVDGQHVYAAGTGDDAIVRFNVPRLLDVSTDGSATISVTTSDAEDVISLSLDGQPSMVTIDTGGDGDDDDSVMIQGTSADDTVTINGGTLTFESSTISITSAENLELFLDDGDDTVNLTASAAGPESLSVDGDTQSDRDVLNIDAQTAQVVDTGSTIMFTGGLRDVDYGDFETVAITNATPTINNGAFVIAEDAPVSTSVGTPDASDPEAGESLTWRIVSGNTGGAFSINSSTGEITVNTVLDFEALASYALVVEVEDNQTLTDQATITITVTDVEPMISNQNLAVDENASNGESVGTAALDPGDQNSVTYEITDGNFEGAFAINNSTGEITVDNTGVIDFEQQTSFDLTVEVTDDGGITVDTAIVTVDINDVSPSISNQTFSVAENASNGTTIDTVSLDFGDENSINFSIDGGNIGNAFSIDSFSGEITINDTSAIDFEASPTFALTVSVIDDTGNSSSATVTINVSDVEPAILDQSFSVAENASNGTTVGTVALDTGDDNSVGYSISGGNNGGAFAINSSTGQITVADSTAIDFEVANSFALTIAVSDDGGATTDSATVTVNVNDVEPMVGDQSFNVFESQTNGSGVGTVTLDSGDMNSVVFSIAGGNTGGAFTINSISGLISVADSDAITAGGPPFALLIEVTDDGGTTSDSGVITINVLESPASGAVFDDAVDSGGGAFVGPLASLDNGPGDGTVSISSIDAYGQFFAAVYDPIDDDPAGTTFDSEVYFRFGSTGTRQSLVNASGASGSSIRSLSDEANSTFNIGDLTFALTQTLEPVFDEFGNQSGTLLTQTYRIMNTGVSPQSFELLRYLDGDLEFDGSIEEGGGRLKLPTGEDLLFETDLGTSPETSTKFLGITGFGGTIPEDARFQIEEFSVLQSAIINGDPLTDNLSNFGSPVDNNGDQFVDEGLEFDLSLSLANLFVLGASQSATYTTHTLFGSDSPVNATGNTAPTINTQSFNVDENSAAETFIGTVLADDVETPSNLTFAVTGGDPNGFFSIDSSTGVISVANSGLDHEANSSFDLTVRATDPGALSSSTTVTINIGDLNEAPLLAPIGNRTAIVDQELSFTALAADPDSPPATLTFSLGAGAPAGANITSAGAFTFSPSASDDGMSFPVTVIVTEGNDGALTASESITISVSTVALDFGDAPASYSTTLANDGPRHVIGSLFLGSAVDPEVNGQPSPSALGDDNNSTGQGPFVDDEGGITFLSALNVGKTREFRVNASQAGFLDAWIDFDQSGDFTFDEKLIEFSDLIIEGGSSSGSFEGGGGGGDLSGSFNIDTGTGTGISIPAGFSTVSFSIPNTALPGPTFARFRLSSTGGLSPTGLASDGEVEDYLVSIAAPPVGNSNSIETALGIAVDGFFNAFPDELNDPDPNITGNELPLAVQAEGGSRVERRDGAPPLNQTDPNLRIVIQAINDAVARLEQNRGPNENILVLATHPVDFLLTDTQGRTVGFTQARGTVNEIGANATFSGDGVVELLTIRNADPGEYGLQLVGVGGVFRGGSSLITPSGTQRITFQGSLAQNSNVQLALTYQEGLPSFPTRKDLDSVNFSEIANLVAQIPTDKDNARTLAAGATEALASIALDRLDASLFSRKDGDEAALQALLERISLARKKLLDAIETSLDEDELEKLKLVFGDDAEDTDSVEALARVLLETLSGPLISAPRQVKDLSSTLQQLLDQLQEQRKNQQKLQDNQQPANANDPKGATKPETEDKRTSQRTTTRASTSVVNSTFIFSTDDVAARRRATQTSGTRQTGNSNPDSKQNPSDPESRRENRSTDSPERAKSEDNSAQVVE